MPTKRLSKTLAAVVKRGLGKHDGSYRFIKRIAYLFISILKTVKFLSPINLSYYFFKPQGSSASGYVTNVKLRGISGLAFRSEGSPPVFVELLVDGTVVNRTFASQKVFEPTRYSGENCGYYLPMKEVWSHILHSQSIQVHAGGKPLQYRAGLFRRIVLPNRGAKKLSSESLIHLTNAGHLINKFGRIQKPRHESKEWADKAFGNYAVINSLFEKEFNKPLFAFYGAMLGYAREGGILPHDLDLDLAYFSEQKSPEEVRKEFFAIASRLEQLDIDVQPFTYKLQFKNSGLSVTPCWISDGVFSSTFGYVGDGFKVTREDILPLKKAEHDGHPLWLPNKPEAVAAYLYGKGWKYPDPGWKWLSEYKSWPVVLEARLTEKDLRELQNIKSISGEIH